MFFISLEVPEYNPELFTRIGLLLFRVFYGLPVKEPKVVILEKACGDNFLVTFLMKVFEYDLVSPHLAEVVEWLFKYVFIIAL